MLLYHGGHSFFTKFDYSFIGSGSGTGGEGYGFYFTNNKEVAISYSRGGYLYACDVKFIKELHLDKLTITKPMLRKLLKAINKKVEILSNYGDITYYPVSKVLDTAIKMEFEFCTSDVDLVGSLVYSSGNTEAVLSSVHELFGYDHIKRSGFYKWGDVIVSLVPDNITIKDVIKV